MALAWKAGWVKALRGSNPLSSAAKRSALERGRFVFAAIGPGDLGGVHARCVNDGSPILRCKTECPLRGGILCLQQVAL